MALPYTVAMTKEKLASFIDHTLLAPNCGINDIIRLCNEAKQYKFASVCVNPCFVSICKAELADSGVKVCTVIGFPLGATTTEDKAAETARAVANGADEVDMVINMSAAIDCRFNDIQTDIAGVVKAARKAGEECGRTVTVKVILETCFLKDNTIETCCLCAVRAGADFVKTSTGFAVPKSPSGEILPNGASVHHVGLMRQTVGESFGVKASGGIRSARALVSMIEAGANRIGTSSGVAIVEGWDESAPVKGYDA